MTTTPGSGDVPSFLPAEAGPPPGLGALVGASLRRPGGRRSLSVVTVLLLIAGVSMFAFPAFTDALHKYKQHQVSLPNNDHYKDQWKLHHIKVGQGLTRLVIRNDRVKVNVVVVEGTTLAALEAGAGHYPDTPFPCEQGNVGIAGHRTTYGRPFNKIDKMRAGDTVDLYTPFARCTYRVVKPFDGHANPWVVAPNSYSVVSQRGTLGTGHWLTLTSCNPLGSDAQRIVLRLSLDKVTSIKSKARTS